MIQPNLLIKKPLAASANSRFSTTRKFAKKVNLRARQGNPSSIRVAFSTFAASPEPGTFTAPAALTDDTAIVLEAGNTYSKALSDGDIERGQYYDLSEWYYNGGNVNSVLEVDFDPVQVIDR